MPSGDRSGLGLASARLQDPVGVVRDPVPQHRVDDAEPHRQTPQGFRMGLALPESRLVVGPRPVIPLQATEGLSRGPERACC